MVRFFRQLARPLKYACASRIAPSRVDGARPSQAIPPVRGPRVVRNPSSTLEPCSPRVPSPRQARRGRGASSIIDPTLAPVWRGRRAWRFVVITPTPRRRTTRRKGGKRR